MKAPAPSIIPSPLSRRSFLALAAAASTNLFYFRPASAQPNDPKLPITGTAHPDLEPFDKLMTSFVQENKVPGAAVAITHKGKVVYARGFGHADVEKNEPVQPASLFRIASVSKPFTAVAILQLIEKGKIKLTDKVIDLMNLTPHLPANRKPDPRWQQITVQHCLQHRGGWDRDKSYDPIGRPWIIARAFDIEPPVTPDHIVRYMMGQTLDFDPGERYAYSNLGYLALGRVIEAVTGQKYETHVKKEVLAPLGIDKMHLGRALLEHHARDEVHYYDAKKRTGSCLYPPHLKQQVPIQYGAENLEGFEAHGGWIASAIDLVKFAAAFDEPAHCPILDAKLIDEMWTRPPGLAGKDADGKPKASFYGCGWLVRPVGKAGKLNTWHNGFIAGSEALLVRRWDSLNWAVLFNTANNPNGKSLTGLIDARIHEAADKVKQWPNN